MKKTDYECWRVKMRQRLVVVGNGMAGVRCVEEILKRNSELFSISIIGSEPHPNYNRILLSSVLQGEASFNEITINKREWYEENGIDLYTGETAIKIDSQNKQITTNLNRVIAYDKLIIATGSEPFVLPIPGVEKEGVVTFRTIEDCKKIIELSKGHKQAAVIGGGVLGLEAARGLVNLGLKVKVVHNMDYLMQRQLDPTSSKMLQTVLEQQGIEFYLGKVTEKIAGEERVEKLEFTDGTEIEADLVVMAVGVKPNIGLAKCSGIETSHGIIVNDYMETRTADIYALGECAQHNGIVYGLVKPLYEQGQALANHLCGIEEQGYQGSILSTSLKVPGVELFSVGDFTENETSKMVKLENQLEGIYKKIVFQGDIIVGAVLFGETASGSKLLDLIAKRKHVNDDEKRQLLQINERGPTLFKQMPQSEMICNCNAVSKGTIMEAVLQKGLTTVDEIKQCTKASGSCGGCKSMVAGLLTYINSDECDETIEQNTLCKCTELTEDEVVYQIQQKQLSSLEDVFTELNWKSENGCSTCISAIRYYLAMIYPGHDRSIKKDIVNAQLEEDGTYSLVLQMYGGMTNVNELQMITNVMKKYQIREVGLTAEQRFQLKGIQKEVIHAVCTELKIPSIPALDNTIRYVNTFFGERLCQCSNEKSKQLAIEIEKEVGQILTPHLVIIGFSACKHQEKDLMIKDISIIGNNGGWEIYVGGSTGQHIQQGELLTVTKNLHEVKLFLSGFVQYYRETGNYQEPIYEWIKRVGMIHIREVLFETSLCRQLVERLEEDRAVSLEYVTK